MNFIGHATVALWRRSEPAFVLGSMLPDFAGMARARLAHGLEHSGDPRLDAIVDGIALHHRTDDVFHGAPQFVTLLQETLDELASRGIARGTARAVGHVGVEMFIDGELVRDPQVASTYTEALTAGNELTELFVDLDGSARWELLRQRLIVYGAPYDYRNPDAVLARLQLMLRGRPRLAIADSALPILRRALPALQRKVSTQLPSILDLLRAQLA